MMIKWLTEFYIDVRHKGEKNLNVISSAENHHDTRYNHNQQEASFSHWLGSFASPSDDGNLFSISRFLGVCMEFREDQLSPWKEEGDVRFRFGPPFVPGISSLGVELTVAGIAACTGIEFTVAGITAWTGSSLCFFGFASCWCPGRKLPTSTYWKFRKKVKYCHIQNLWYCFDS